MKVYLIIEEEYYPESPDYRIIGVVESIEEAEKAVKELEESVKDYNKSQDLYDVSYEYEEFELGDTDNIKRFVRFNIEGRKDLD